MLNKKLFISIYFFCFGLASVSLHGQACTIELKGQVTDDGTLAPLSSVYLYFQETQLGTSTDDNGYFSLSQLCPGEYHLILSHIGCEPQMIHLHLEKDTIVQLTMEHTGNALETVVIEGHSSHSNAQPKSSVNRQVIEDNSNQNLSALLENEPGVHLIKNGNGVSKPVVHGLFGNRVTILNNGVAQSGQQWGNDHSPEIDPYTADKITILKGPSSIEYGNGNIGSVILIEPKHITGENHLHGAVNYAFESNGRGNNLHARLEQKSPFVAWRINGSLRKYGDQHTADYYLNNTGLEEASLSLLLEKSWKSKLFLEFYASTFNTTLGILRGSHIGNLTDLEQALVRDIPFFTEDVFKYNIDAPKQNVSHHLAKIKAKYFISENQFFEILAAAQLNDRKEFDLRRGERSDIPALSIQQYTFNSDLKYTREFDREYVFKAGFQVVATDNTNDPTTGILPLIPDYISWKNGLFSTITKSFRSMTLQAGFRYDLVQQNVAAISSTLPREIIRYSNTFQIGSGLLGAKWTLPQKQSLSLNSGIAMRNPAINELYSNGLHQGVSGIEEGDVNLLPETGWKNTLEYQWLPNSAFSFNALLYHQWINNYIFLQPQDEIRLTIRGAFPVFAYEQTNASIYGLDIATQLTIANKINVKLKYSYVRGDDLTHEVPLIYMPPTSLYASLKYRINQSMKVAKKWRVEETEIELNNRLILEQKHILTTQDFIAPPSTYNLIGLKLSGNLVTSGISYRLFVKVDNILNVRYRDYLNRQRYFADDLGRSLTIGIQCKF